ncbi:MAG: hypothetical protein WD995_08535, partial [Gemmatimonadota bacterium]
VALVTTLAACGTDAESSEDRDSQRVPEAGSSAPAVSEVVSSIPAGTVLTFEVREDISTSSHAAGDGFSLVLVEGVSGTGGASLSAGAVAMGVVTEAHKSSGPDDDALLAVRINSVEAGGSQQAIGGDVQATEIDSSNRDSGTRTAAKIATGTAAGAIIGQILGGNTRSTVQGAAAGTVVGVVVALSTRGGDATLPAGSRIVVRLDRALVY